MSTIAIQAREAIPSDYFSEFELARILEGTPNRRYGLVKRALANGDLIQLRRGIYSLGKHFQRAPLHHFELAQRIYVSSYVSLESALAFHSWIPEGVYTTTSICMKRSASFDTPVGSFSYTRIPEFNFIGVERLTHARSIFLVSSPTKAITDYVVVHKVDLLPNQLRESLRIEEENWKKLSYKLLEEISESYRNLRLRAFVRAFRKGL